MPWDAICHCESANPPNRPELQEVDTDVVAHPTPSAAQQVTHMLSAGLPDSRFPGSQQLTGCR